MLRHAWLKIMRMMPLTEICSRKRIKYVFYF